MKCLTIQQPWAWAIIHGPKRVENRSWPTDFRGDLLIHAGKSRKWLENYTIHARYQTAMVKGYVDPLADRPDDGRMVLGAILGVVRLADCVRLEDLGRVMPFAEGPWCWILEDVLAFREPVPFTGAQGLFDVADEVVAAAIGTLAGVFAALDQVG